MHCPSIMRYTRIVIVVPSSLKYRCGNVVNGVSQQWMLAKGGLSLLVLLVHLMLMASLLPMDNQESTSGHTPQEGLRLTPLQISVLAPINKVLNLRHLWENTISVMKELQTVPPLFATTWTLHCGMARAVYRAAAAVLQVVCIGSAAPSHSLPRTTSK